MAENKQLSILNVNDDLPMLYLVTRILQQTGFTVIEAESGAKAMEMVRQRPDLVILDINLPDISGFEVCRRIKGDSRTARIPVLHLSASRIGTADKTLGLEGGADAYLTQPVEAAELTATVRALLSLSKAEERARGVAQEWETVFNAIGDGVCLLDDEGRIQRCNRALTELVGRGREDIIGVPFADLMADSFTGEPFTLPTSQCVPHQREIAEIAAGSRWLRVTSEAVPKELHDAGLATVVALVDITDSKEAGLRQRAFLRDILASVTEGQLHLCFDRTDLPQALGPIGWPVSLTRESVRSLRLQVRDAAQSRSFDRERQQDLETAVGEGAMNAVVHAKDAFGWVCANDAATVQVWLEDRGEGIAIEHLPQATLERGYTTAGSLGHGFYLMLKTVARIYLLTGPSGTTVVLEQDRDPVLPSWLDRS